MPTGLVFNIQRYSLHDGPGIRTTVFLKGCPLRCLWCHNPEGISPRQEFIMHHHKCLGCGNCINVCPENAIFMAKSLITIDKERCSYCSRCVEECPAEAIELVGKWMTVAEVLKEVEKDRVFFNESGGGVTVSGGEPLMQPDFLTALLAALKTVGRHTAVETSGQADGKVLERVAGWTDLFLYDLKVMDAGKSKKFIGAPSDTILNNLHRLVQTHEHILVRIPIIPSVNDDEESIRSFGSFLQEAGLKNVQLLPYHRTGIAKYAKVGREYELSHLEPPAPEAMIRVKSLLETYGLNLIEE